MDRKWQHNHRELTTIDGPHCGRHYRFVIMTINILTDLTAKSQELYCDCKLALRWYASHSRTLGLMHACLSFSLKLLLHTWPSILFVSSLRLVQMWRKTWRIGPKHRRLSWLKSKTASIVSVRPWRKRDAKALGVRLRVKQPIHSDGAGSWALSPGEGMEVEIFRSHLFPNLQLCVGGS